MDWVAGDEEFVGRSPETIGDCLSTDRMASLSLTPDDGEAVFINTRRDHHRKSSRQNYGRQQKKKRRLGATRQENSLNEGDSSGSGETQLLVSVTRSQWVQFDTWAAHLITDTD